MTDLELTDYADRYLTDSFSTVAGVGRVRLGGERELSMRVWLDPIALAARDITTQEGFPHSVDWPDEPGQ